MGQEYTDMSDRKRTTEELCRDINLRAEEVYLKVSKKGKYILLGCAIALVVFTVWQWQWVMANQWWWAWIGTCVLATFIIFKINQKLIYGMKRAASPEENLRLAKRLKRFIQLIHTLGCFITFLPCVTQLVHEEGYGVACFVTILLLMFGFIASGIDSTLNDDLHELEYRLDE